MKENTVSAPLKGNSGVFVVSPYQVTTNTQAYDEALQKTRSNGLYKYMVSQSMFDVLKDKEEIVDNRSNFY
jgi:hypothetical protein